MKLTIDFETRSEIDLTKTGMHRYAEDESTDVLCLSILEESGTQWMWVPDRVRKLIAPTTTRGNFLSDELVQEMIASATHIEAHNSAFEMVLWNNVMVKKYGFKPLDENKVYCSAAMAAMCSLPRSLDGVSKALLLEQEKDLDGRRIMLKMCKPRKPLKGENSDKTLWHDDPEEYNTLINYCEQDTVTESAVSWALYDLPESEREVFLLDYKINNRGIRFDIDTIKTVISNLEKEENKLLVEMKSLSGIGSPKQTAKTKAWIEGRIGKALKSIDKYAVAELLQEDLPDDVRRVLEIRATISKSSTAKYNKMLMTASSDGRGRGQLLYHGANTGRWAGKGIQPHNLPRGFKRDNWIESAIRMFNSGDTDMIEMTFGSVFETASNLIRAMLIPDPGYSFRVGDFSSIEARKLAWLAGDENSLNTFYSGKDIYIHDASGIFGVPYDLITPEQRQVGKVSVLALGYQGWVGAYQAMAVVYGLDIPDDKAINIAGAWRDSHPEIVTYWSDVENAAMQAVQNPGKLFTVTRTSFDEEVQVKFGVQNGWLQCLLPSGRRIYYRSPGFTDSEKRPGKKQITYRGINGQTGKWDNIQTYGGKLVENITQASARDVLVHSMFNLEDNGYPIVLHIHDEVIAEIPDGYGSNEEFSSIMEINPPWAKRLPIRVPDVWTGKRYRKS